MSLGISGLRQIYLVWHIGFSQTITAALEAGLRPKTHLPDVPSTACGETPWFSGTHAEIIRWHSFASHARYTVRFAGKDLERLETNFMSQHRSLRAASTSGAKRNVLKRFERVALLKKRGQWKTGDRVTGLRKTKPEA
jgi:small basic protein (TIGR04137 family)